ncbi:cytidine deaminase [Anaerolineae bacterium CFX7]|nr:cytidine deaminase [Anaerolineae bacterium CFX7]
MKQKIQPDKALARGLLELAAQARAAAYVPYSHYQVGAAVVAKSGKIYTGCNVENASYGLTVCAERNAIFKGVTEGEREFVALAVVTANGGSPCGACRQVAFEFMRPDAPVYLADETLRRVRAFTLGELLRDGFTPQKLRQGQQRAKRNRKMTKP